MPEKINTELLTEAATIGRHHQYQSFNGLLQSDDKTLKTRGGHKGLEIYEELERDGHTYSQLQKRKGALAAHPWQVTAGGEADIDKKAAEFITEQLEGCKFSIVCYKLLDALNKGYAVGEIIWDRKDGLIVVDSIKARAQDRFVFDEESNLRLLTKSERIKGEEVPERKYIVHSFGAKDENPYGRGLGEKLFWPNFFKKEGLKFWMTFADKFGNPTAVAKYPHRGTKEEQQKTRDTLLGALNAIASDTGIVIPEGTEIMLLEAKRSGSVDTYEKLLAYMDKEISKIVLGETLTSDIGDVGSKAASETHNDVRIELAEADANLLACTLIGSLIKWLVEFNFPDHVKMPKFGWVFAEEEDLDKRANRDKKLHEMGYDMTPEYVLNTYGDGYVKREIVASPAIDKKAAAPTQFAEGDEEKNIPDMLTNQLEPSANTEVDKWLDDIKQLVDSAESLEELRDTILEKYDTLGVEDFAELLGQALFLAELQGRDEAS